MKSRFLELADAEAREAIDHYDQLSSELGDRFIAELRTAVRHLEAFPESSPTIARNVRKKVLLEFPYTLFYQVAEAEILVLAVAHQSRRPGYWRRRAVIEGGA